MHVYIYHTLKYLRTTNIFQTDWIFTAARQRTSIDATGTQNEYEYKNIEIELFLQ